VVAQAAGNFLLPAYSGLIVKDTCWRWPDRELAGNAIDFLMRVLGLSFHDAMRAITGIEYRPPRAALRCQGSS
jgi:hypothetical protein